MRVELNELKQHWDRFGQDDPMWAVLTDPDKRHGRWDRKEFFESGRVEVDHNLRHLQAAGADPPRGRALDFGCGPGRATQALCRHFSWVNGVDIAPSMIELARTWNDFGDRCTYTVNDAADLSQFGERTFDLVYSCHVMQHMAATLQERYFREFVRCLSDRGVAFIEIAGARVPGAERPLPDTAFRAEIAADVPPRLAAGRRHTVPVRIRNASPDAWPARGADGWYCVSVANRWRARTGELLVGDDARGALPADLRPGEAVEVPLAIRPPAEPGRVVLEVDMVQEGVAWFQDKGSTTWHQEVELVTASEVVGAVPDPDGPRMEMHVLTLDACRAAIESAGGHVVDVTPFAQIQESEADDFERYAVVFRRGTGKDRWERRLRGAVAKVTGRGI